MAGTLNLSIDQGSTFSRTLTITDAGGAPVDLTGQTFTGQIRKTATDATIVATFTCTLLNQITDPGKLTVVLPAAASSAIALRAQKLASRVAQDFAYDIERTFPSGTVERLLDGVVSISPEVTRV